MISDTGYEEGERVDVRLTVNTVERVDDTVAYRAWGRTFDGQNVVVTVFADNRPDRDLEKGKAYALEGVEAEPAANADFGVMTKYDTRVHLLDDEETTQSTDVVEATRGHEIVDGGLNTISLSVENIEPADGSRNVDYWAWCQDTYGGTVIVTVFDDDDLGTELTAGEQYRFEAVRGETWEDGTPGVTPTRSTVVVPLDANDEAEIDETQDAVEEPTALMIDAVERDEPTYQSSELGRVGGRFKLLSTALPRGTPVALSALVPTIPLAASLLAPDLPLIVDVGLLVSAFLLAGVVSYYTQHRPNSKLRLRREQKHAKVFLEILQQDYFDTVDSEEPVRANVMTRDGHADGAGLSVFSSTGEYDSSERTMAYDPVRGEGPWGRAFRDEKQVVFDAETNPQGGADFTSTQEKIVECRSSLSVPIYSESGPQRKAIGVLTLDSEAGIDEVGFDTEPVKELAYRYSRLIGEVVE